MLSVNYLSQWWVEFDDELGWLFTKRSRAFKTRMNLQDISSFSIEVYEPRSGFCGNPSDLSKKSHILVSFRNLSTRYRNLEAAFNDMVVCVKLFLCHVIFYITVDWWNTQRNCLEFIYAAQETILFQRVVFGSLRPTFFMPRHILHHSWLLKYPEELSWNYIRCLKDNITSTSCFYHCT